MQELRERFELVVHGTGDVVDVEVAADVSGHEPAREGSFRNVEGEAPRSVADVEDNAAVLRFDYAGQHAAGVVQHAVVVAVVGVGDDIARAKHRELMALRKRFGMLFQEGALFDNLTVAENVAFPLVHNRPELSAKQRRERVAEVLDHVELPGFEDRIIASLSGGQRKRVGLARAIATEPEVVLFDEPNSGLDPFTSDSIDESIVSMKQRLGITFIVISHDIIGTLNVADWLGMLYEGKLIAYGPTEELLKDPHPVLRRFLSRNVSEMREDEALAYRGRE